jgi:hypothetical protein
MLEAAVPPEPADLACANAGRNNRARSRSDRVRGLLSLLCPVSRVGKTGLRPAYNHI